MGNISWPEDHITQAKELWRLGYSAARIGEKLGRTRNSVISQIHRMGMNDKDRPITLRALPEQRTINVLRSVEFRKQSHYAAVSLPRVRLQEPERPIEDEDLLKLRPTAKALNVRDHFDLKSKRYGAGLPKMLFLSAEQCRYPSGDVGQPDFEFCNSKRLTDQPYCREHLRLCYNKLRYPVREGAANGG